MHTGRLLAQLVFAVTMDRSVGGPIHELPAVDVLVVGNGPSGMALALALDGHQPYLDPTKPHPDPSFRARLQSVQPGQSVMEHDFSVLAAGLCPLSTPHL